MNNYKQLDEQLRKEREQEAQQWLYENKEYQCWFHHLGNPYIRGWHRVCIDCENSTLRNDESVLGDDELSLIMESAEPYHVEPSEWESVGEFIDSLPVTSKQKQVLRYKAVGLTNAEISDELEISERSVELRLQNIRKRLGGEYV